MIRTELPKSYNPAESEGEILAKWETVHAFHAEPDVPSDGGDAAGRDFRGPYCILIPPPNVTAALHLGHALNNTLQDVLIRAHRLMGFNTLWMPGTDHAGIATQTVVEKRLLQNEGKRRTDYSREEFVAKVQAWKDEYEATILEQLKAMGASCDFERTRFTMDEMCAKAVREAFFRLFKDGLIYRGKRLVNWDPVTQTALADDEVEMREVQGAMHYLRYPLVHPSQNPDDLLDCEEVTWSELAARGYPGAEKQPDDDNAWLTVATTRPETYLGDTAVAVNPKDPRAPSLRGLMVQLPLVGRVIPIVEDDFVVMPDASSTDIKAQIATGFLKVTPAHDPNDYEIGQRHGLEKINVMAPDATISDKHGWPPEEVRDARIFIGLTREEARGKVIDEFKARGLLEAVKPYTHSVGHSYRSHVPIEPYLSDQWYVKVTDDRMKGEALRAMADDQFEGAKPARERDSRTRDCETTSRDNDLTSRDRKGAEESPGAPAQLNLCAFFISFTCYGTWLHGDPRGSVDSDQNLPGMPVLHEDEARERREFEALKQPEMTLGERERETVQQAIIEVCEHRGWRLLALHVRTNHVHAVVIGDTSPEKVMNDFKSYATRRLRSEGLVGDDRRVWTRHGSTRYLKDEASVAAASKYVIEDQGEAMSPAPIDRREDDVGSTVERRSTPLPYGRGSLTNADSAHTGDGELRFFPARYAKTFQQWHENLRDWCISRQLWWGHRIPVWQGVPQSILYSTGDAFHRAFKDFLEKVNEWEDAGRVKLIYAKDVDGLSVEDKMNYPWRIGVRDPLGDDAAIVLHLEEEGLSQDPDVLDTWFSSGLWPLSTMGWPEPDAFPETVLTSRDHLLTSRDRKGAEASSHAIDPATPLPGGRGSLTLLDVFNPSSVLCTAREIITLWVSRMVMFNRYFRRGTLPFRHVYIHPMIQDGHGQKMSKSLGNGVDPRDIIRSHGADALRFTLAKLATATQDVRLPVDMMCPHEGCGETFEPKEITTPGGHRVAAPEQTCPQCGRKMISGYGHATGLATPTKEIPLARNVSRKFDEGRNFANKLWNATRFALSNLNDADPKAQEWPSLGVDALPLVDRWMISRLHRALHTVEDALEQYQYNVYADAMYDLVWREFCDWYLEAIKPTVRESPAQQQVLRTMLSAILRMLHPVMPFVTEALWPHVQEAGEAGLPGIELPSSELLCLAPWPDIACSVHDKDAEATFTHAQALVEAIRNIRGERNIPPRRKLTLHIPTELRGLISATEGMIETLAGLGAVEEDLASRPDASAPLAFEGHELHLSGLFGGDAGAGGADLKAERARLTKMIQDKQKAIAGFRNRLTNENYVKKAPANLVEETRSQLAQAEADLAAAQRALESLGS